VQNGRAASAALFHQEKELSAMMKNYDIATVLTMKEQVAYQPGQVVSKTLAQNDAVSVTLFAFDKGEEISTHESGGDALVLCLDGEGRITVDGVEHILHESESILMPARHPHAVFGQERFKMLLVVVF
jgi:cupin domain-containing protein